MRNNQPGGNGKSGGMKVLMLAWRDMENPKRGGAEVVTDRYLQGLAGRGHEVVLFSSRFGGCETSKKYHGYEILRRGGSLGVYPMGMIHAFRKADRYDVIIDQINTIPFFTFLTTPPGKRICFFHQLCRNVWFWEMTPPFSWFGYLFEALYLRFYRQTWTLVVSDSTAGDLRKIGFRHVRVIENAIEMKTKSRKKIEKKRFQLCMVGRLKKSKRVHDAILAVSEIRGEFPDVKLVIVGDGDRRYYEKLDDLVKRLNLQSNVEFLGHVSSEVRNEVMAESEAILVTSIREGWGLIVTEANANGTPAITYDVHGLRDANKSGIIVEKNTPAGLADAISGFFRDEKGRKEMGIAALKSAGEYLDWEIRIDAFEEFLRERVANP